MPTVDPWFPFRKAGSLAKVRLFCLPPAGGGATLFREWSQQLPATIEVCAIQLPGRERRLAERLFTSMSPLVDATVAAMTPLLDRPFAFFGHSMGGLVAFEVIRHLRRIGSKEPVHFFASASPAPHHPDDDPIHHLSDDAILERLSKEGEGYPKEILANPELMEVLLPLARADATVTETHTFVAEDPLACPITAFIAREDHKFTPEQVRDWRSYTRGRFREIVISGGHDFIKTESSTLTRAIADALAV